MAIFHQHFQVIGRGGRSANVVTSGSISGVIGKKSAVAASAYRSGTKLEERIVDADGKNALKVHDYTNKGGVIHSEILAPDQVHTNAWVYCRQELWNKVQEGERYKNAQYCREFDVALPVELTQEENIELIRNYVDEFFVARGMVADLSMHCDNEKNPHAHVMLTMRELVEGVNGDWSFSRVKNRQWNAIAFLKEARSNWAERVNKELELRGFDDRISALSYSELGISLTPTKHEGPARYISNSRLTAYNKEVVASNARRVIENPEIVLQAIGKVVFTRSDIEKAFAEHLSKDLVEGDFESLNKEVVSKFLFGMEKIMSSKDLVNLDSKNLQGENLYGSRVHMDLEKAFVGEIMQLQGRSNHIMDKIEDLSGVSVQQKAVIENTITSSDIAVIEGLPGAGKTTIMKPIVKHYEEAGYKVLGAAPSAIAARNLGDIAGFESKTIAKYLWDWNKGYGLIEDSKTLLIVDEMSMVDLPSMYQLVKAVNGAGGKIILSGDTNQFGAIGAKGAAQKAADICGKFCLNEVRRQLNPLHAEATKALAGHNIDTAFDLYQKAGALHFSNKNCEGALVEEFVTGFSRDGAQDNIVLAYSNKAVVRLNEEIRRKMQMKGVLSTDEHLCELGGKKLFLAIGDNVVFGKNSRELGVANGEVGKVVSIVKENKHDYYKIVIESAGRNIKIDTEQYNALSHGYALTCFKAQGKTFDNVYVLWEPYVGFEAFNVMMTRHRNDVRLFVSKDTLIRQTKYPISELKQIQNKVGELDLLKQQILKKIGVKESNLFASDYLAKAKIEKVLQYVELNKSIESQSREFNLYKLNNPNKAQQFKEMFQARKDMALYFKENWSDYKEYMAAVKINMVQLKNLENDKLPPLHQTLENLVSHIGVKGSFAIKRELYQWYGEQKLLKQEALKLTADLTLKQELQDSVRQQAKDLKALDQDLSLVQWNNAFRDSAKAYSNWDEMIRSSKDIPTLYQKLSNNPELLGKVKGFKFLSFESSKYNQSYKAIREYFAKQVLKWETKNRLASSPSSEAIGQEIKALQQSLEDLSKNLANASDYCVAKDLTQALKENRLKDFVCRAKSSDLKLNNTLELQKHIVEKKSFLRYADLHFDRSDFDKIFHTYIRHINNVDPILLNKNEIKCGSLQMCLNNGLWNRFSAKTGGNIFGFVQEAIGCTKREALELLAQFKGHNVDVEKNIVWTPVEKSNSCLNKSTGQTDEWQQVKVLPDDLCLEAKELKWIRHEIEDLFEYRNSSNKLLGYIVRAKQNGNKIQLPLSYCAKDGKSSWRVKGFGMHLYGAEKLALDKRDILLVEGEKTAEAAQKIFPEYAVVAIAGTNKIDQIKWQELNFENRKVVIWPDNDKAGIGAATVVANKLKNLNPSSVTIVDVASLNLPSKWDLADAPPQDFDARAQLEQHQQFSYISNISDLPFDPKAFKGYFKHKAIRNLKGLQEALQEKWSTKLFVQESHEEIRVLKAKSLATIELRLINNALINKDTLSFESITKSVEAIIDGRGQQIQEILKCHPIIRQIEKLDSKIVRSIAEQIADHENMYGKNSINSGAFNKMLDNANIEVKLAHDLPKKWQNVFLGNNISPSEAQNCKNFAFEYAKLIGRSGGGARHFDIDHVVEIAAQKALQQSQKQHLNFGLKKQFDHTFV